MKKPPIRLLVLGLAIIALVLTVATVGYTRQGLRHVEPARALRQARQDWQTGQQAVSLSSYAHAYAMAVEAGLRWQIAQAYIDRMMAERQAGQLDAALRACGRAVGIVAHYDDEGGLSRECFAIETDIGKLNELR